MKDRPLIEVYVKPDGILIKSSIRGDHFVERNKQGINLLLKEVKESIYDLFNSKQNKKSLGLSAIRHPMLERDK